MRNTPSRTRHEEFRVSFRVSFRFQRSTEIVYGFVFLSTHPPTLGDFVWCRRVAERFIRQIIGFCLLLVRILDKLLSVPKSELCLICVRGHSWGIKYISIHYLQYIIYHTIFKKSCLQLNSAIIKLFTVFIYVAGTSAQRFVLLLSSNISENVSARKIRIQRVSIARSNRLCDFRPISIKFVKSRYILIVFCTIYERVHHSVTLNFKTAFGVNFHCTCTSVIVRDAIKINGDS